MAALALAGAAALITGVVLVAVGRRVLPAPPGPPPPPEPLPALANLYGVVYDAATGAPLAGVQVNLNGWSTSTNNLGHYLHENVEPGAAAVTVIKDGYQTAFLEVTLMEGNNEMNNALTPKVTPPSAPVTIDSYKIRVLEWGPETRRNVIEVAIGLTNNTGKTLVDQTLSRGRLRNSLYDEHFKSPGTDYERDGLGQFFAYRPWDTGTIPDLSPGKSTWQATWVRGRTYFSTYLQERGVVEGTPGITIVFFNHADIAPTPIMVLYQAVAAFTGIFSSQWQSWQPTVFTPPEPPEEDGE